MNCFVFFLAALAYVSAQHASTYPTSNDGPVGYHGPLARPVVLSDGHLADTHEVAAARHGHYVAVDNAAARSAAYYRGHGSGYSGHGTHSYGPGTDYVYRSQYGYTGVHPAPYGYGYGYGGHGVYSYGSGTGDIYRGLYGYTGLHSTSYGHGYPNRYYGHGDAYRHY